jgi:hypothetical protein
LNKGCGYAVCLSVRLHELATEDEKYSKEIKNIDHGSEN